LWGIVDIYRHRVIDASANKVVGALEKGVDSQNVTGIGVSDEQGIVGERRQAAKARSIRADSLPFDEYGIGAAFHDRAEYDDAVFGVARLRRLNRGNCCSVFVYWKGGLRRGSRAKMARTYGEKKALIETPSDHGYVVRVAVMS
jgi:hypothetical protein